MKYLKTYNESNQSINELYFELVDILQSKVFDDWNIISATDENFDNIPEHKFWIYVVDGKLIAPKYLTGVIDSIFIYNIDVEEHEEFFKCLKDLESIVEDITGKQLFVNEESSIQYITGYDYEVYDYIIRLK